jgi:hypothetical protein
MTTGVPVKSRNQRPGNNTSWLHIAHPTLSGQRKRQNFYLSSSLELRVVCTLVAEGCHGNKEKALLKNPLSEKLESSFSGREQTLTQPVLHVQNTASQKD